MQMKPKMQEKEAEIAHIYEAENACANRTEKF